jgi:hypothetical protein
MRLRTGFGDGGAMSAKQSAKRKKREKIKEEFAAQQSAEMIQRNCHARSQQNKGNLHRKSCRGKAGGRKSCSAQ